MKTEYKDFYPNGQLEWFVPFDENEKPHGEATQYYPTGEVKKKKTYSHGKIVGDEIQYFRNGVVMAVLPFVDGWKHGTYRTFYESGALESETDYDFAVMKGRPRRYADSQ